MKKRILIIISILIHILAYRYFKMQNRNLVILIFSVLAIIFNNITLAIVLDDLEAKFKRIFLASNSIFLLNITLYSASGFFSDLLLYNQSYKYLNLAIILNFLILNIYLISKLKFKRFIYIPILHIVSCFIAYLTLGLKFNLLINILISIISIFLIFREKKVKIKIDVINLLNEIIEDKKYSNLAINSLFDNNSYSSKEKAYINNMLNVTLKNLIYIDYVIANMAKNPKRYIKNILRVSIAQMLYTNSDEKGIIYESVEIAKQKNEFQAKFVNATLRNFLNFKEEIYENASVDIKYSYPKWIVDKIKNQFGEEKFIDVLKSYKDKSYFSIRVNFNKISKEEFLNLLKSLDTEVLFNVEDVYYLNNNKILKTKAYINGDIYIQDASSYLAAKFLDVKENEMVYDAACYPGNKSLVILDKFNPKELIATDIHENKVNYLKKFEKKYSNFKVYICDASKFNIGRYDKILLDLPCSGLGVLRKKPEKIYNLKQSDIKEIKRLQKKIFKNAYELLKKGGEIVYSTCTIIENENTNNVEYFLEKYKDLEVVNLEFPENVKVIKDKYNGNLISYENKFLDGFYIIKFRKK